MSEGPNLLLDTCAIIFVANDSPIDPQATREISEAAYDGRLYLSPMSAWEIGIGVAKAVTFFIGMPSAIELWAVVAGLLVSASVGIFFGVWPARKGRSPPRIVASSSRSSSNFGVAQRR